MEVKINGQNLVGWKSISINQSVEKVAGKCSLVSSDSGSLEMQPLPIFPGDEIEVVDEGQPLLFGWVDKTTPSISATSHSISASCRDKTGDIVDCSVTTGPKWKNIRVDRLAAELVAPFGLEVEVDSGVDLGEPFSNYAAEPSEKVFQCLNRALSFRSLLATSTLDGKIRIQKPGIRRANDDLILGANIVSAQADFDVSKRFSNYTVVGQRPVTNKFTNPSGAIKIKAESTDEEVTRFRPLKIVAGQQLTSSSAQQRANFEATSRAGKSNSISVVVKGFRQSNGEFWEPNLKVSLSIAPIGIVNEMLLISSVDYVLNDSGRSCTLKLVREDAFDKLPVQRRSISKADLWSSIRKQVRGG